MGLSAQQCSLTLDRQEGMDYPMPTWVRVAGIYTDQVKTNGHGSHEPQVHYPRLGQAIHLQAEVLRWRLNLLY
jgi:hypothetical protein